MEVVRLDHAALFIHLFNYCLFDLYSDFLPDGQVRQLKINKT